MRTSSTNRNRPDFVLLSWTYIWSLASVSAVSMIVRGSSDEGVPEDLQMLLGIAIGGTVASLTLLATWAVLIHLPAEETEARSYDSIPQRHGTRFSVIALAVPLIAFLSFQLRDTPRLLAEVILASAISTAGASLVFQWTRQRIHRGMPLLKSRRSIRQILGVTTTIAFSLALVKLCKVWFGISTAEQILVLSNASMWICMLFLSLYRWWSLMLLTVPLVIGQSILVSVTVDMESRTVESELMRSSGIVGGSYLVSMLMLSLMRSSGHRWFAERVQIDA